MPFLIPVINETQYSINALLKDSTLVKAEEHKTETVHIHPLKLREIPEVMKKMGWNTAAALMERWFNSPAFIITKEIKNKYYQYPLTIEKNHYDDTIVKMDWYLDFLRSEGIIKNLRETYLTPKSKALLIQRLENANFKKDGGYLCPPNPESARELNAVCQIQTRPMGSILDTINDLYGSLGEYFLQIAVIGTLNVPEFGNAFFKTEKIGIYLKDIYEFNDFQFLGFWTKEKCLGKKEIFVQGGKGAAASESFIPVEEISEPVFLAFNSDFRKWREKHAMGGDFIIYSDVHWVDPGPDSSIEFTASESKNFIRAKKGTPPASLPQIFSV